MITNLMTRNSIQVNTQHSTHRKRTAQHIIPKRREKKRILSDWTGSDKQNTVANATCEGGAKTIGRERRDMRMRCTDSTVQYSTVINKVMCNIRTSRSLRGVQSSCFCSFEFDRLLVALFLLFLFLSLSGGLRVGLRVLFTQDVH